MARGWFAAVGRGDDAEGAARKRPRKRSLQRDLMLAAALTLPVFVLEMGAHLFPAVHHWVMDTIGMQDKLAAAVRADHAGPVRAGPALLPQGHARRCCAAAPDMNSLVALGTAAAWAYSAGRDLRCPACCRRAR